MVAKFCFCNKVSHCEIEDRNRYIRIAAFTLGTIYISITYEKCVIPKYKTNLVLLGMTIHVFGLTEQER